MKKKYLFNKNTFILLLLLSSLFSFSQAPTITSFMPTTVCPGAIVVITGTNFSGATAVRFNGVNAASFTVNSNTQITATLAVGSTTGTISVTKASGTGSSITSLTVNIPAGDQVSYGSSAWIGYVYATTNSGNPPSNAFSTNYQGFVNQAEIFDLNLVNAAINGPSLCGTYADNFAVRFKMNKNLPAGNYTFNVGGDDGYRLSLDGGSTFVISNYTAHSYQSTNYTVFLSGNTNFVLEYFENTGQSRVQFSYTYCPTSAGTLSGTQYLCTYSPNQTTTFSSTIAGGTWSSSATGIATVNASTGVVTGVGAGTATITYNVGGGSTGCPAYSSTRDIYVASSPGLAAVISGSQNQCQSSTANYTITPVAASFSYTWSYSGTGATITPAADGLSATIVYSSTATSGNILVRSANACGSNTGGNERYVTVGALPTAASISGTTSVCIGAAQPSLVFTNPQSYGVQINYNVNGGATQNLFVGANATTNLGVSTGTVGTFIYNLISVQNGVGSPSCFSAVSGSATVTVNALSVAPTTISGTTTICNGSSTTLTVSGGSIGGGAAVNWYTGSCGGTLVGTGTSITVSPTANTIYYVRYEGTCNTTSCVSATVAVSPIISNNSLSFTNGTSGQANATAAENANAVLTAPAGTYFNTVDFASYGTATGTAPSFTLGSCNAAASQLIVENQLLGNGTTSIPATNGVFGDPCVGTLKRLYVLASYSEPLCSGSTALINGSTPAGGTGVYTYLWESSTTSPTAGFAAAAGTNNLVNYTSGLLTQTTYFRRTVTSCSFTNTSAVTMVKVNAVISSNTISGNQAIFCGATPTTLTGSIPTGGNGTYIYLWESSTTSASTGFTAASGTNSTSNYTPGALTTNTWYRRIVTSGSCVSTSLVTAITINATAVPIIGTITQPSCAISTGSVVLNGLPTYGTWTITRSGTSSGTTTGTASSATISGLAVGNYTFTVSVSSCVSSATANVPINALVTTTYNGTSWSSTPTANTLGVIAATGTIGADVDLCSCTVNTGVTATVATGVTMRLQNELTVSGTGSITFKDTSSLVQINNTAVNTGLITYERQTTPISRFDYTYYCSPVSGQTLFALSSNTLFDKFFSFDSTADYYKQESPSNVMGLGVGYIVRGPQSFGTATPTGTYVAPFKGVPYNGILTTPIGPAGKSNLIGNPYPSALDANLFLDANAGVLEGTIYFWTHNTSIRLASALPSGTAGTGVLAYTSDDYAAYNRTGGVATASPSASSSNTTGVPPIKSNAPSGQIASGQAFFGTSVAPGNANFNNSMRVGFSGIVTGSNADFFKFSGTKKAKSVVERNRIWLDLTNAEGAFKETLLGYISGATNENESAFDGETFDGNAFVDFYTINDDKNLTIQGRALPFNDSEVIPLGYTSTITGEFGINIREKDGLFETQKVYLEDKLLGIVFDLGKGIYTFTTVTGKFNDRFAIRYTNKTLGIEEVAPVEEGIYISYKNKQIKITSAVKLIDKIQIYDLSGKLIYLKTSIGSNEAVVSNLALPNQVLIVKATLNDGLTVTKKLIF